MPVLSVCDRRPTIEGWGRHVDVCGGIENRFVKVNQDFAVRLTIPAWLTECHFISRKKPCFKLHRYFVFGSQNPGSSLDIELSSTDHMLLACNPRK